MFHIEDELHAEYIANFSSMQEAILELIRIAKIPWDKAPNRAPCISWRGCARKYVINEFDITTKPWKQLKRINALSVDHSGQNWDPEFISKLNL